MSCSYTLQLDDYVDDTLARSQMLALDAHLPACESCRTAVVELRAIRAAAASLERHAVPPYLWRRMEQELRSERTEEERRSRKPVVVWRWPAWTRVAAGALVLITAIGAVAWTVFGRGASTKHSAAIAATPTPVPESVEAELTKAQEHYERAIAGLEQITSTEGGALDQQTSAILQKGVSVIDRAIDESRAALATQPSDPSAQKSLFDAMDSKVALLQDTVALINGMRRGNSDGTPRTISRLRQ